MSAPKLGAKVITNWQPTETDDYETVADEWNELVRRLCGDGVYGFYSPCCVREPRWSNQPENLDFHRDNYDGQKDIWVLVWTNRMPTEVELTDGTILSANDGDVILLDNERVLHRTPRGTDDNDERCFARAMIPKNLRGRGRTV